MLYLRIVIKEDEEHSNHFPVIVVSCMSYTRDVDYQWLNKTVITPVIYHTVQNVQS